METSVTIRLSELDNNFIEAIKKLFSKDREITISVTSATDFDLNIEETKEEYLTRLIKAKENLDKGKGISFTEEELKDFVLSKLTR